MPFEKVDLPFLSKILQNKEKILEEYENEKQNLKFYNPHFHDKWNLFFIKEEFTYSDNADKLPTLKKLLQEIPENYYLAASLISVVNPGMVGMFHNEPYDKSKGYRRYHVPLQIPENVEFEVEGEPIYKWEEDSVYEFLNPETMHRITYPSGNQDRIVLLVDVFENYKPTRKDKIQNAQIALKFVDRR